MQLYLFVESVIFFPSLHGLEIEFRLTDKNLYPISSLPFISIWLPKAYSPYLGTKAHIPLAVLRLIVLWVIILNI